MASKAYVTSMTVAELTSELKKRGLNARGKKKVLQARLEEALYDEEDHSETSSEGSEVAAVRAASAVINQFEGQAITPDICTVQRDTLSTEQKLIVSIERIQPQNATNGENVDTLAIERDQIQAKMSPDDEAVVNEDQQKPNRDSPNQINVNQTGMHGDHFDEPNNENSEVAEDTGDSINTSMVEDEIEPTDETEMESNQKTEMDGNQSMETQAEVEAEPVVVEENVVEGNTSIGEEDEYQTEAGQIESDHDQKELVPDQPVAEQLKHEVMSPPPDTVVMDQAEQAVVSQEAIDVDVAQDLPATDDEQSQSEQVAVQLEDGELEESLPLEPVVSEQSDSSVGKISKVGVSSDTAIDTAPIELDVVVSTVEDDFSAFSAEAAEVESNQQNLLSSLSSKTHAESEKGGDRKRSEAGEESKDESETSLNKRRRISTSPKRVVERRRRWGSSSATRTTSTHTAISSDTLQEIIPADVKEEIAESLSSTTPFDIINEQGEDSAIAEATVTTINDGDDVDMEDIVNVDIGKEGALMDEYEQERQEKEREREQQRREAGRAKQELETRRRIEARIQAKKKQEVKEEKSSPIRRRTPSPAKNPPSRIVHIKNLTRPFTTLQLKELLQEDGELVNGGFWTDRIKSHCIAIYTTMDVAIGTRNRLHGLKWPSTNPKLLSVDYLTTSEVSRVSEGQLEVSSPSPTPDDGYVPSPAPQDKEEAAPKKNDELKREKPKDVKEAKDTPQPSTAKHTQPEKKKKTVEKATRVLDQLFRKTKATPPIYWLPLTEEEAAANEAERLAREADRERRMEERRKEREREQERNEKERRDRERRIREEREHRARERMRRRSYSRSRSRSRSPRRR